MQLETTTKRKQLNLLRLKMNWMLNKKSELSIENKLLLYKCIIVPIWTYGIQLWGSTAESNIEIIQRFQSKTLRTMLNAPWFITNESIHNDLNIPTVRTVACNTARKYKDRMLNHPNKLASELLTKTKPRRRLKRKVPRDLA